MKKQFLLAAAVSSLTILPLTAQAESGLLLGAAVTRDQSNADDFLDDAVGGTPVRISSPDAEQRTSAASRRRVVVRPSNG